MFDLIKIEKVNTVTGGLPFICGTCGEKHDKWDYLRVWLEGNPNPRCIHLRCLLNVIGFSKEEISKSQSL